MRPRPQQLLPVAPLNTQRLTAKTSMRYSLNVVNKERVNKGGIYVCKARGRGGDCLF